MRNFKLYLNVLTAVMMLYTKNIQAQSPYIGTTVNDLNWSLQTSLSDEFSGSSLDNSKWTAIDLWTGTPPIFNCCNWGGHSRFKAANVSVGSGVLSLKVEAPTGSPPYTFNTCCNTGGILSNNESYSYGYLEMYADLPGFIDGSGVAHGDKFMPCFWPYHQEFGPAPDFCEIVHDEIDILEPSGAQYADAKTNVCGVWNETTDFSKCSQPAPPCSTYCTYKIQGQITSANPLCSSYHKFAVEWNTDRAVYYLDDVPFFVSNDAGNVMDPMRMVIDQQIWDGVYDFYSGQPFPDYMKVDYFHYYTLRKDCSTNLTIQTNTDLANYWTTGVPAVKSNITFGDGTGTISLGTTAPYIFRAVNTITINGEFTVPLNAEFTAEPTPCN